MYALANHRVDVLEGLGGVIQRPEPRNWQGYFRVDQCQLNTDPSILRVCGRNRTPLGAALAHDQFHYSDSSGC
jgi:hypothetical protein